MINAWWLLLIVPASAWLGMFIAACCFVAGDRR